MYLKQFIFVNWGNLPNHCFDFGPINLFSGGNGSGKTTAADAIQTLMTAAHDNIFSYNPGQDESTQRTRGKNVRTLASYILGCDDGSYSRPHRTDGFLVANFHPSDGEEGQAFSAVLHARAHLETSDDLRVARLDSLNFYIVREHALTLEDFVEGDVVTDGAKLYKRLCHRYPAHLIERYDRKKSYLSRLFGALRGRDDSVQEREALHAAKTFSRFMAYKPVRSINEFVAQEVLEKRDLGEAIRNVSSLMKTIHGMEASARRVRSAIELLEGAGKASKQFIATWLDSNRLTFAAAQARHLKNQSDYVAAKREQQTVNQSIQDETRRQAELEAKLSQLHRELVQLEAQRHASGDSSGQLNAQLEEAKAQLRIALENTKASVSRFNGLVTLSGDLFQTLGQLTDFEAIDSFREAIADFKGLSPLDSCALVGSDWIDETQLIGLLKQVEVVQPYIDRLAQVTDVNGLGGQLVDSVLAQRHELTSQLTTLKTNIKSLQVDVDRLERSRASYPNHIAHAVRMINQALPGADARVLCDYVQVTDSRWQSAIEGYMGGARFNIIVDPAYEADAASFIRESKDIGRGVRVIQGDRAKQDLAKVSRIPSDSIVHLMTFEHASAEAFVKASFASVVQVDTSRELAATRRGVMANGLAAAGYAMFNCALSDGELVFGQGARERSKLAKRERLTSLLSEVGSTQASLEAIEAIIAAVKRVDNISLTADVSRFSELVSDVSRLQKAADLAKAGDHGELDDEVSSLFEHEADTRKRLAEVQTLLGAKQHELKHLDKRVQVLASAQAELEDAVDKAEDNLRALASKWSDYDLDAAIDDCEAMARETDAEKLIGEAEVLRETLSESLMIIERNVMSYNQEFSEYGHIEFTPSNRSFSAALYDEVVKIHDAADDRFNRLKNNVLAVKYEQIAQYKASFDNIFVTHLCHSVYQAVNEGKRALEELNEELQHHVFGADRERYSFAWDWEPEFKDYWDFFEAVTRMPSVDGEATSLFGDYLSSKLIVVRDKLMSMLLDEDESRALKNLEQITDYRSYRRYEIYKTPEGKDPLPLSRYGTGSGGQLETPAYIIRAAAITSAFKFSEPGCHLRLVLVDEAFSKMDEHRSREVIQYLTERLGLQLSFVMPTSKSGPFMDVISNQFVFAKVPVAAPRGELATGVLVDRQALNQERVKALWESHRESLRTQAEMEFLAEL